RRVLLLVGRGDKAPHAQAPEGRLLALQVGNRVALWDRAGREVAAAPLRLGAPYALTFDAGGRLLAAGCEEGVAVWSVPRLEPLSSFRVGNVTSVALHPCGRLLAPGGREKAELWSLASNRPLASYDLPSYAAGVAFSADGKLLLAVAGGRAVVGWPVSQTPEKRLLLGHGAGVPGLAF